MNDEPIDDFSTLRITAEENILYLLEELDRALERGGLAWTPDRARVTKRLVTSVADKLGAIAAEFNRGARLQSLVT